MIRPLARIPWARVLAEAVLIVASVLLAFGIEAWWSEGAERRAEIELLRDLRTDFAANDQRLEGHLGFHGLLASSTSVLLDSISNRPSGAEALVPDSAIGSILTSPTYDPLTSTLDAALASGDVDLLRHAPVREALADWSRVSEDLRSSETAVRDVVHNHVVPLLAEQVSLAHAFDNVVAWSLGDAAARSALSGSQRVRASSELEGAVGLYLFNARFVARDLARLDTIQADILGAIDVGLDELGGGSF